MPRGKRRYDVLWQVSCELSLLRSIKQRSHQCVWTRLCEREGRFKKSSIVDGVRTSDYRRRQQRRPTHVVDHVHRPRLWAWAGGRGECRPLIVVPFSLITRHSMRIWIVTWPTLSCLAPSAGRPPILMTAMRIKHRGGSRGSDWNVPRCWIFLIWWRPHPRYVWWWRTPEVYCYCQKTETAVFRLKPTETNRPRRF